MFNRLHLSAKIAMLAAVLLVFLVILGIVASVKMLAAEKDANRNSTQLIPALGNLINITHHRGNVLRELRDFTRSSRPDVMQTAVRDFNSLEEFFQNSRDLLKTAKDLPLFVKGMEKVEPNAKMLKMYSDSVFSAGNKQIELSAKLTMMGPEILDDACDLKAKMDRDYAAGSGRVSIKDKDDMFLFATNIARAVIMFNAIVRTHDTTGLSSVDKIAKDVFNNSEVLSKSATLSDGFKRDVQQILKEIGEFDGMFEEFVKLQNHRDQLFIKQSNYIQEFDANISEMAEGMIQRNINLAGEAAKSLDASVAIVISLSLIALVLGIILCITITGSIVKPISIAIQGLSSSSAQVTTAAGEISNTSQSMANGATEQASNLEEVSSSLGEITSMTKQTADNAKNADALVKDSVEKAKSGQIAMGRLQEAVIEIQNSSNETAKILKDIDEIAFQTNLLALNAAVEAARAGEA
ncbi:MAG: methyl-accepting chemotaxis protein, partial [Chitinispirillales bacterium]|nr:methyl-accepting chemotaxis protein [Chitinispirillales bacterium]